MIPRLSPKLGICEIISALNAFHKNPIVQFETKFAKEMRQDHALSFPYGRTGLTLLLQAWGFQNKEIICPAYTCVVVPHAIVTSGNIPVFVDSQDSDFNMDLTKVEHAITDQTAAIIITSIFGYPADLDHLERIRKKYPHIKIIQDCAHSFSASWNGKMVQQAGDAAIFGLNISKLMTSIFGGMVTTDNSELFQKLHALREQKLQKPSIIKSVKRLLYLIAIYPTFWTKTYGLVYHLIHSGALNRFVKYYDDSVIDMPSDYLEGLTKLEARVGITQLRRYSSIIEERRTVAAYYDRMLIEGKSFKKPPLVEGATYSHYVVRVPKKWEYIKKVAKKGVELGHLIEYTIPLMSAYKSYTKDQTFKTSKEMAKETINLPLCKGVAGAKKVVSVLNNITKE